MRKVEETINKNGINRQEKIWNTLWIVQTWSSPAGIAVVAIMNIFMYFLYIIFREDIKNGVFSRRLVKLGESKITPACMNARVSDLTVD